MVKVTSKKIFTVYFAALILLVLYILSQTVLSSRGQKKAYSQKIVFIHEADIPNIDGFIIHNENNELIISKADDMWLVYSTDNPQNKIPADTQKLKSLFLTLATGRTISKAGNKTNLSAYGLNEQNTYSIAIYKNGTLYKNLLFGDLDFSQTQRYFTDDELNSVFYHDTSFDNFLTASVLSWCDPFIISSQLKDSVFNTGDIQTASTYDFAEKKGSALTPDNENWNQSITKLLELRHGGFPSETNFTYGQDNLLTKIQLETGNLVQITLEIYKTQSTEEFNVKTTFFSELSQKEFSYNTAISLWTYNKIKEIML